MSFETHSGPVRSGTVKEGAQRNTGLVVLSQSFDSGSLAGRVVGNTDTLIGYLPAGSQIQNILIDQYVAATTGTTTVSVGTTSGGAELSAAVVTTAGGRFTGTTTAATAAAWQPAAMLVDTPIYVRCAVGTATLGAGAFAVNVIYVQRSPDGLQAPVAG